MTTLLSIYIVLSLCLHAVSALLLYGVFRHISQEISPESHTRITDMLRSWETGVISPSEREEAMYAEEN